MFKHILVATDGSTPAGRAVAGAIALARSCGARVTALMVVPDYNARDYAAVVVKEGSSGSTLRLRLADEGLRRLDDVLASFNLAGVETDRQIRVSDTPHAQIVACANELHCDLIVMAPRGRGVLAAAVLGSQTVRVLSEARIPVLVMR